MTPTQAAAAIRNSAGQCWCSFEKKDGTQRVMRFRHQVVGPIKGTGTPLDSWNQIRVWDDDANGYRTITCDRLLWLDVNGKREDISKPTLPLSRILSTWDYPGKKEVR